MTLLLHINEASVVPLPSREASEEAAAAFAALILAVKRRRGDAALVSAFPLAQVTLFEHHTLGEWGKQPANRDRWRLVRLIQNRSPGWHLDGHNNPSDYRVGDQSLTALGNAHMSEGLLVSFPTSDLWDRSWILGTRDYLTESNGELELAREEVQVRHGAAEAHLDPHLDWITVVGSADVESGSDLRSRCAEMFTKLKFLPQATAQLETLDPKWVTPVTQSLSLINRALVEWPADSTYPSWYTHVTPDSERRRTEGLLDFEDFDGVVRTFDTHARFTPGAGRLHFRLDNETRTATVAYVGQKIV